jgi:rRNA maturation protein Nop10
MGSDTTFKDSYLATATCPRCGKSLAGGPAYPSGAIRGIELVYIACPACGKRTATYQPAKHQRATRTAT